MPRPPLYPSLLRRHTMNSTLILALARVLMALAFIGPGASHVLDSAKQRNHTAAAIGAVEVAAGLAIAFAWQVRWLALAAAAFLMADAFLAHNFWAATPQELRNQVLHFFKNRAGGRVCTAVRGRSLSGLARFLGATAYTRLRRLGLRVGHDTASSPARPSIACCNGAHGGLRRGPGAGPGC